MRATLNQIEAFYWVARLGSFHAAACHLNLTQPTISARIRGFEEALGLRLFERAGRGVRVSTKGALLLPQAARIATLAEELSTGHGLTEPLRGRLRLGAPDSVALTCLPDLLAFLKDTYAELEVALSIDNSLALGKKLNERELDFAFLVDPKTEPYVGLELLGCIDLVWVGATRLNLPHRILGPEDLLWYEIFTNPEPSNLMEVVRTWFAVDGLKRPRISTCNNLSVILSMLTAGAGVGVLPLAILPADPKSHGLQVLSTRPEIARPQLFSAYLLDKTGPGIKSVLETGRALIARSSLLDGGRRKG